MATVNTAEFEYKVDSGDYLSEINKMENANEDLEESSNGLDSSFVNLTSTIGKVGVGIGAVVVALNKAIEAVDSFTNSIITNSLNQAEIQKNLDLTQAETDELAKSNRELSRTYGLGMGEVSRLSALNSEYVDSLDQLQQANLLVAQTATLYALKEGDVSLATDQAVTAQEGLRDVVLTGSTTAFEDGAISIEKYRDELIELNGWTQAEADVIADGSNGVFEYTEALSKASDPQTRFQALSAATADEFAGLTDELSLSARASIKFQQTITAVGDAVKIVTVAVLELVIKLGLFIKSMIQATINSNLFKQTVLLLTPIVLALAVAFKNVLSFMIPLINAVVNLAVAFFKFLYPAISICISIISILVTVFISSLLPALTLVADFIITGLIVTINALTAVIILLTPILQYLANVLLKVAFIINAVLSVAVTLLIEVLNKLFTPVLKVLNLFNDLIDKAQELSDKLTDKLKVAFEELLKPINAVIDVMQDLLDLIINITNNILDGLIGAINSIPFVNIGEEQSIQATQNSRLSGFGSNNVKTNNNQINYSISYQKAPSLRQLQRERRLTKYHGEGFTW